MEIQKHRHFAACKYCLDIDLATVVRTDPNLQFHWFNDLPNTLRMPGYFENLDAIFKHHHNLPEMIDCALAEPGCEICRAFVYNCQGVRESDVDLQPLTPHARKETILQLSEKALLTFHKQPVLQLPLGIMRYKPASDMKHDRDVADKPLGISLVYMEESYVGGGKWGYLDPISTLQLVAKPDTYPGDIDKAVWLRRVALDPSSKECLSCAASWLKDCMQNHDKCTAHTGSSGFMPTRAIAVGNTGMPRLQITRGHPQSYAALSYCWGADVTLRLIKDTLDSFQHGIPWDRIPQTLSDAMKVVKTMGIPYIWIDALCIIQDSTQDWLDESQLMNDVYMHATVTIVAANAESCSQGILQPRLLPADVAWPKPLAPGLEPCTLLPDTSKRETMKNPVRDKNPEKGWHTRGWTLQEQLSSRRILSFTNDNMTWDCLALHRRESGHSAAYQHKKPAAARSADDFINDENDAAHLDWSEWQEAVNYGNTVSDADLVFHFYDFVAKFDYRMFTFDYDRLPAAAGIAKMIEGRLQGRDIYIGGLWKSQLALGLTWGALGNLSVKSTETAPRVVVPSWSWAASKDVTYLYTFISQYPMEGFLSNAVLPEASDAERYVPTRSLALEFDVPVIRIRADWMLNEKTPRSTETLDLLESYLVDRMSDESRDTIMKYTGEKRFAVAKILHVKKAPFILRQAETSDAIFALVLRGVQDRPGVWERWFAVMMMESPQVSREETRQTMEIFDRLVNKEEWQVEHIVLV